MPSYGERLGGGAVCPLCQETASSEAEMSHRSRVDPLPSSEADVRCVIEGPEREPSSEAENELPARGYIRDPRARRRLVTCSRVVPLPSSEAEIAQRTREGPSNEAEIVHLLEGDANGPHAGLL